MGVVVSLEKPDALMDVLDMLKPRGRIYCCSEMSAPLAMSLPVDGYARFHVIERGGAWLRVDGVKQVTPLASGDLVIVPHGNGHILADSPKTKPVPIIRLVKGITDSAVLLRHGGRGAKTLMICGSFQIVNSDFNPLLALLPPLIHIPSAHEQLGGWLGALRDPQIGAAIGLIHRDPQRSWSVSALAREVAMSRSIFAAKFSSLVGEPPLTYLTRWRLWQASRLLAEGNLSVGETALRVGYESEAAFSKAFKRHFGQSPLAYHRGQVQTD